VADYGWMGREIAGVSKSFHLRDFAATIRQFFGIRVAGGKWQNHAEFRLDPTRDQRLGGESKRKAAGCLSG
jgi:hypothetical protein